MEDTLKLLFIITGRDSENSILELVSKKGGVLTTSAPCDGTVQSSILTMLGIGKTEKSLIVASVTESSVKEIYTVLVDIYKFNEPNQGIAFTIPISAVGGPATLAILNGNIGNK